METRLAFVEMSISKGTSREHVPKAFAAQDDPAQRQVENSTPGGMSRRSFIYAGIVGGAALLLGKRFALGANHAGSAPTSVPTSMPASAPATAPGGPSVDIWVFHGEDKAAMMKSCMKTLSENGGFPAGAKKLTLKVNAAWFRSPAQGANTHPELADGFLKGCKDRGLTELVLPEHSCDRAEDTFAKSGLLEAAKANGARMINMAAEKGLFKETTLERGQSLKQARVARDFLETDVIVNMPVAKHHGGAGMTCAMKNWMGAVEDRGFWHKNNLHQCIADFSTLLRPNWTIIDATRIMLDKGPQGPTNKMDLANLVILCKDQVAADAYMATLMPEEIQKKVHYLRMAREMKLGAGEPSQWNIHKIEVA
jgi:uncharacterized protein (DUF362 family)